MTLINNTPSTVPPNNNNSLTTNGAAFNLLKSRRVHFRMVPLGTPDSVVGSPGKEIRR